MCDAAIAAAHASGGYGKAIGEYFGLHYSRVSRIAREQNKAEGKARYPPRRCLSSQAILMRFVWMSVRSLRFKGA